MEDQSGQDGDQIQRGFQNQGQGAPFMVPNMLSSHSLTDSHDGIQEIEVTPRPENTIEIPEILDMIMSKLDRKSLGTGRLVCKQWNDSWLRVISQHPATPKINLDGKRKSVTKFLEVLRRSNCPAKVFQHLKFNATKQSGMKIFQRLLRKFGWTLRGITLNNCSGFLLILLSTIAEFCPNLEDMTMQMMFRPPFWIFGSVDTHLTGQFSLLKRLTFCCEAFKALDVDFLTAAVQASPNLKYLSISGSGNSGLVFQSLQNLPEITEGLEELRFDCEWTHEILEIALTKLKSLELNCGFEFRKSKLLTQLLNYIGFSLETLTLAIRSSQDFLDMDDSCVSFPVMAKLRVFNNLAYAQVPIKPKDLTKAMPTLETWVIGHKLGKHWFRKFNVDNIFSASTSWDGIPHLSLKKLIINQEITRAWTLDCINEIFPNLTKLSVSLSSVDDKMDWTLFVPEVFQSFSETNYFSHLTHLTISLKWIGWNVKLKLHNDFSKLMELPNLQHLAFINTNCGGRVTISCPEFVHAVVGLLDNALKLQTVTFVNFQACIDEASLNILFEGFLGTYVRLDFTTEWSSLIS